MTNWKTTLAGIILGLPPILAEIGNMLQGLPVDYSKLWGGIGAILLGLLAKDHNVTGGTKAA